MALGADPELALAVGADAGEAGMRLDIALVRRLGLEAALDDDVGLPEALLEIAMAELVRAAMLEAFFGAGSTSAVIMSSCRSGAPGFIAASTSVTCGRIS